MSEEEFEDQDLSPEEFDDYVDRLRHQDTRLEDLIYEIIPYIADSGIIVSSAIVFEMINHDGKMIVSVLHNKKSSKVEIAHMLISAYKNIGSSYGGYMTEGMDDEDYDEEDFEDE